MPAPVRPRRVGVHTFQRQLQLSCGGSQGPIMVAQGQHEPAVRGQLTQPGAQRCGHPLHGHIFVNEITKKDQRVRPVFRLQPAQSIFRVVRSAHRQQRAALPCRPGPPKMNIGHEQLALRRQPNRPLRIQPDFRSEGQRLRRRWRAGATTRDDRVAQACRRDLRRGGLP